MPEIARFSGVRMKALYNILLLIFLILSAPYYLFRMCRRGDWKRGFAQRFGKYDSKTKQALTNRHVLWIHAVSVGEVNICVQLIQAIEPKLPNMTLVVSTTTSTGMAMLRQKLPSHIQKIYYPIDYSKFVSRAISVIKPKAVIMVEAEIWPNLIWRLKDQNIPLFLVNARFSERSYRRYRQFGALFGPLFRSFAGVGAQTKDDALSLKDLGFRPEAIKVIGSLKYDAGGIETTRRVDVRELLTGLKVPKDALILLGGSTHAGEEELMAEIYLRLKKTFPKLLLIIAPRHSERGREVGRVLEKLGLQFIYRSQTTGSIRPPRKTLDCLLVNTTGELVQFYECADVIFVGKSLRAQGGQNPIEPAALGKAVIFGPHMRNFADIAEQFVTNEAAIQIQNDQELEQSISRLLGDAQARNALGANAVRFVQANEGTIDRTLAMILAELRDDQVFIASKGIAESH